MPVMTSWVSTHSRDCRIAVSTTRCGHGFPCKPRFDSGQSQIFEKIFLDLFFCAQFSATLMSFALLYLFVCLSDLRCPNYAASDVRPGAWWGSYVASVPFSISARLYHKKTRFSKMNHLTEIMNGKMISRALL